MADNDWCETTLGEFVRLQRGHDLPIANRRYGSVPVMGSAGVNGYHDTVKAKGPGVTIGRSGVGSMGVVSYCPVDYWPHNTVLYVTDFFGNDARFAYYFLKQLNLRRFDSGSVQASLNRNYIYPIRIYVPRPREQKSIAYILDTLDEKIELNRRMNETLEAMARAIFKSWFVGFDPVRSKMDGRKPAGMDDTTAALFPDSFEDSELGKTPKDWSVCPLPEVVDINPKRVLPRGSIAPYLDMKNMPTRGHRPDEVIDREFKSGTKFINGDTLLARITPCLENGKTAFVDFLSNDEVGWGSTEYIVFRPKSPLPVEFGYYLARSEELRSHAIKNMTGSSGRQRVPSTCFDQFLLAVPSAEIARCFGDIVRPFVVEIRVNSEQSKRLATIRDTLLPKLLSGEIRVSEAEQTVAEVA